MPFMLNDGRFHAVDNGGAPLVAGQLFTYVTGTTTPLATYTSATLGTPNTNPVVLNARGEASVWLGSSAYTFVLKDATGVTIWTVDNVQEAVGAATLADSGGSALVGFIQAGTGAIARTAQDKMREHVSVLDFAGCDLTMANVSDTAIQAGINYLAGLPNGGTLEISANLSFGTITPKSNVSIYIPTGVVLQQVQPSTNISTGFLHTGGTGALTNFHVYGGGRVDGGRVANPANVGNHCFTFKVASETISNISFRDIIFSNPQEDAIRFAATDTAGFVSGVRVHGCTCYVDDIYLYESTNKPACDLVRFEQTYDTATHSDGYGNKHFFGLSVTNCRAEKIRTLADFKRGCAYFELGDCRTKNMYDCHHSVDGSFHGSIWGCTGYVESTTTIDSTFGNFMEIQGEHILINGCSVDGGGKLGNGFFVTDYGRPLEQGPAGVGAGTVGHQSVGVTIKNCSTKGTTSHAYRLLNGICCSITDNFAENAGGRPFSMESGGTRNDTDGVTPLLSHACHVGHIKSRACTTGSLIGSTSIGSSYTPCRDEAGQDFYDVGASSASLGAGGGATGIAAAVNAPYYNDAFRELNANTLFMFQDSGSSLPVYYAGTVTAGTVAPPNGSAGAVTLTDASGTLVSYLQASATPLLSQGQRLYMRISAQYNSSAIWSVQVDELDSSSSVLASYYYGKTGFNLAGGGWIEYDLCHIAQNANCIKIAAKLNPAAATSSDGASTGATNFANWRWSRTAIGVL